MLSVILYVGTLKLIHEVVWSHVPIISSLIYDSLLHLFVYFNLMLMHVSSVVSDLCEPMDCSSPGSSVHGILQARILEWVAISAFWGFSWPWNRTCISCICCIGRWILNHCATWEGRRQWHPIPVLLPGKFHGRRSLVSCSPWGRKESDTTERLHFYFLSSHEGVITCLQMRKWRLA